MREGTVGSGSILPRSQRTWTSTVRVSPAKSKPHTCKQQALASEDLVRVLHEEGQQIEFAWLEVQRLAAARARWALTSSTRSPDGSCVANRRAGGVHLGAPNQRLHARQQLVHAERLGQVVVGADFQPDHWSISASRAVRIRMGRRLTAGFAGPGAERA